MKNKQDKEEYLKKRQEAAEKAGLKMCECGRLLYDLGEWLICGDCYKRTKKCPHPTLLLLFLYISL